MGVDYLTKSFLTVLKQLSLVLYGISCTAVCSNNLKILAATCIGVVSYEVCASVVRLICRSIDVEQTSLVADIISLLGLGRGRWHWSCSLELCLKEEILSFQELCQYTTCIRSWYYFYIDFCDLGLCGWQVLEQCAGHILSDN